MNGKGTDTFKTAIQNYLEYRAATDELFVPLFAKPNKSIDECCKYIICEVHKSGMNGFDDDEIFGMAVHYYDENEIEVGNPPQCRIISNVHTDLTEEEKKEARQKAIEQYYKPSYGRCKTATSRRQSQQRKQPTFNPHYLTFDYETDNTHTERDSTTIQDIAKIVKGTTSIRI